jgi:uncharacterized protein YjbJ (UPF0337 family)
MGWMKSKFKQVRGSKRESDGIALGDARLRAEGRREREEARAEQDALRRSAAARRRDRDKG